MTTRLILNQSFTIGLIVICCIVFLWQLGLGQSNRAAILALGVIPASLLQGALLPEALRWVSPELTLITSMFFTWRVYASDWEYALFMDFWG